MKHTFRTLVSVAVLTALTACGGDSEPKASDDNIIVTPTPDTAIEAYSLDLSDAQAVIFTGDSQTASSTPIASLRSANATVKSTGVYERNTAYKILKDGTVEEISVQDINGDEIPRGSLALAHVEEITTNYKVMYFFLDETDITTPYLFDNATGRLFSLSDAIGTKSKYEVEGIISAVEFSTGELALGNESSVHIISKPNAGDRYITAKEIVNITGSWTATQDAQYILYSTGVYNGTNNDDVFAVNVDTQARYDMNGLIASQIDSGRVNLDSNIIHSFDGNTYLYDRTSGGKCLAYQIATGSDGLPQVTGEFEFINIADTLDPHIMRSTDFGGTRCINELPLKQMVVGGEVIYKDSNNNILTIDWDKKEFTNATYHFTTASGPVTGNWNIDAELAKKRSFRMAFPDSAVVVGDYVYRTGQFAESSNDYEIVEDGTASMNFYLSDEVALERVNVATGETTVFFSKDYDYPLDSINIIADGSIYVTGTQLSTGASFAGTMNEDGEVTITSSSGSYGAPKIVKLMVISTTDILRLDGNANDWSLDYRTITDATSDQVAGDFDLTFYSTDSGNNYYYGLVESQGALVNDTKLVIALSNGDTLVYENNTFTHYDSESNANTTSDTAYALGANFEFKINLSAIGESTTATMVSVIAKDESILDTME